jgi:hypothetical protein
MFAASEIALIREVVANPDQILEVCAERHFVAEGVIAADQFAKPLPRARVSDPLDARWPVPTVVGGLQFSSAAWRIQARDRVDWVGRRDPRAPFAAGGQ